jgi:hypothetical protein
MEWLSRATKYTTAFRSARRLERTAPHSSLSSILSRSILYTGYLKAPSFDMFEDRLRDSGLRDHAPEFLYAPVAQSRSSGSSMTGSPLGGFYCRVARRSRSTHPVRLRRGWRPGAGSCQPAVGRKFGNLYASGALSAQGPRISEQLRRFEIRDFRSQRSRTRVEIRQSRKTSCWRQSAGAAPTGATVGCSVASGSVVCSASTIEKLPSRRTSVDRNGR